MVKITSAKLKDAPLVYEIMQAAFAEYLGTLNPPSGAHVETVENVIEVMRQGGAVLAWDGDQAVGSVRYLLREDGGCYIGRVSVLPSHRGRGIASDMMRAIEAIAREHDCAHLEIGVRLVLESNINLYRRLGYDVASIYLHPKGNGQQVATMVKPL
jgi:ribosomal protein S18 acetylase RimI-like enzyme